MSRHSVFTLAIFAAFLGFLTWAGYGVAGMQDHPHVCYAPCTVRFTGPMAEDEFGIDYVGKGPGKGELHVFRVAP